MKLYKDKNIDIRYDEGRDFLLVKFLKPSVYMQQVSELLAAIDVVHSHRVLLDLSGLAVIDQEASSLFAQDLNKTLFNSGIRKLAIIKSESEDINQFFQGLIENSKSKLLKLRFWDNRDKAIAWLQDNYSKD